MEGAFSFMDWTCETDDHHDDDDDDDDDELGVIVTDEHHVQWWWCPYIHQSFGYSGIQLFIHSVIQSSSHSVIQSYGVHHTCHATNGNPHADQCGPCCVVSVFSAVAVGAGAAVYSHEWRVYYYFIQARIWDVGGCLRGDASVFERAGR